jgi:hypothetical protein
VDAHSPLGEFAVLAHQWGVASLLPARREVAEPGGVGWRHDKEFRARLDVGAQVGQRFRWRLQTRGHDIAVGKLARAGRIIPNAEPPRGALLPALLGVPDSITEPRALLAAAERMTGDDAWPAGPAPSLLKDHREVACLRTRLALNRSALNGVRWGGQLRKNAPHDHCEYCPAVPPAVETAVHAIAQCSQHFIDRDRLARRMRSAVSALRDRITSHAAAANKARINYTVNASQIQTMATLATPSLSAMLDVEAWERLLRLTGGFILSMHQVRPI